MSALEIIRPWQGAALAFLVALAAGFAARKLRRPILGAMAGGFGVLAGWWLVFGLITASPRQLPERLPLLALALAAGTPLLALAARRWRWAALPMTVLGALFVGWWMSGAPLVLPDLRRAAPAFAAIAAATLVLAPRLAPPWAATVAGCALLAGLVASRPPGPFILLGAALAAAALGAVLAGRDGGDSAGPAALPLAGATVALAAIPLLARGAATDWAAAAAPFAALLLGAPAGVRLGFGTAGAVAGAAIAGAICAVVAFMMR